MENKGNDLTGEESIVNIQATFDLKDIINFLGNTFVNIYCVDREDQTIDIYRYENSDVGVKEVLNEKRPYQTAMESQCPSRR